MLRASGLFLLSRHDKNGIHRQMTSWRKAAAWRQPSEKPRPLTLAHLLVPGMGLTGTASAKIEVN